MARRVPSFTRIRERAAERKGGEKMLARLMPRKPSKSALAKLGDDRVLSQIAARVFSAGFVWSVIERKWPQFEDVFRIDSELSLTPIKTQLISWRDLQELNIVGVACVYFKSESWS